MMRKDIKDDFCVSIFVPGHFTIVCTKAIYMEKEKTTRTCADGPDGCEAAMVGVWQTRVGT
jgi:hypothetical protein